MLLTGDPVSNVFDGMNSLDENTKLYGIREPSQIGFLTLFEYYKSCEVGENYKNPWNDIWIIHAESHYSVLFSTELKLPDTSSSLDKESNRKGEFYYFDQLGQFDEIKRLNIESEKLDDAFKEDDLVNNGMINKTIRTKWGELADIDWNGSEPIY